MNGILSPSHDEMQTTHSLDSEKFAISNLEAKRSLPDRFMARVDRLSELDMIKAKVVSAFSPCAFQRIHFQYSTVRTRSKSTLKTLVIYWIIWLRMG